MVSLEALGKVTVLFGPGKVPTGLMKEYCRLIPILKICRGATHSLSSWTFVTFFRVWTIFVVHQSLGSYFSSGWDHLSGSPGRRRRRFRDLGQEFFDPNDPGPDPKLGAESKGMNAAVLAGGGGLVGLCWGWLGQRGEAVKSVLSDQKTNWPWRF